MMDSFIDLRQNDGHLVEDSFWPSFTDVMTVIVMVFLIATTVLIVKNWELVHELEQRILHEKDISAALKLTIEDKNKTHRKLSDSLKAKLQISMELEASVEALQKTNEIAEQNQAENISLEQQLENSKKKIALIQLKLLQAEKYLLISKTEIRTHKNKLDQQTQVISSLDKAIIELNNTEKNTKLTLEEKITQIDELQKLFKISRTQRALLEQKLVLSNTQIKDIQKNLKAQESENKDQILLITNKNNEINIQKQNYKQLEQKLENSLASAKNIQNKLDTLDLSSKRQLQTLSKQDKDIVQIQATIIQKNELLDKLNKLTVTQSENIEIKRKSMAHLQQKHQKIIETNETLNLSLKDKIHIIDNLEISLRSKQKNLDDKDKTILQSNQQYVKLQNQLSTLNQISSLNEKQLEALKKQIVEAEQKQLKQTKEYSNLELKYNKLIRPARSVIGKYVVEVRYSTIEGEQQITFKDESNGENAVMALTEVHKKLSSLSKQYGLRLYVKVIIGDESGLSYKDAWKFTQDILRYDYYYQKQDSSSK